ncbi:MAG TPA: hypothetical protein VFY89_08095 [Ktedonobacterales bacterium]
MGKYLGAILAVAVAAAVLIGLIMGLGTWAIEQPAMTAQSSSPVRITDQHGQALQQVALTLQTFPNSPVLNPEWEAEHHYSLQRPEAPTLNSQNAAQDDWVTYGPTTTLTVPAHSLVTMTIENYDGPTPLLNSFYSVPQETTDNTGKITNTIQVAMDPSSNFTTVNKVNPEDVSHTFTIHSIANQKDQPWLYVSVPVTAVPEDRPADDNDFPQPVITKFSFVVGAPGTYIWQCFDPCGSNYDGFGGPMSTKGYMSGTFTVVG